MAMQVDDATLLRLLELQNEDTAIARLQTRRASLPEAARLTELNEILAELNADLEIARKQHEEVHREYNRLEGEIATVDAKTSKEEQRLYSGGVSNPKELSALQAEIEMLKRKKASLEDGLLEVMLQRDQAAETSSNLEIERSTAAAESDELGVKVRALTGDIDAELSDHQRARDELAAGIPGDLLALYDKIRDARGGIGAAALQAGTCQGCHTKLAAKEAERIRAERGLQRCDNCRRILVVV